MPRPNPIRLVSAIIAAILVAPLASPLFLGWVYVVTEGAGSLAEFFKGALAGIFVGMSFGYVFVIAGVISVALIVFVWFGYWGRQGWFKWALLGLAVDIAGSAIISLLAPADDRLSFFVILALSTASSAIASTLVFRYLLLRGATAPAWADRCRQSVKHSKNYRC